MTTEVAQIIIYRHQRRSSLIHVYNWASVCKHCVIASLATYGDIIICIHIEYVANPSHVETSRAWWSLALCMMRDATKRKDDTHTCGEFSQSFSTKFFPPARDRGLTATLICGMLCASHKLCTCMHNQECAYDPAHIERICVWIALYIPS